MFLALLAILFWLFTSFMNLGGYAGRDFWVGGWANIARHMYLTSSILILFTTLAFKKINENRNLLSAWLISILAIFSVLANFSYGIRHDLMVAYLKDFISNSLLIWPYPLDVEELLLFFIFVFSASLVYPMLLSRKKVS